MFITKKAYEKLIENEKKAVAEKWEQKLCDAEKRIWEEQERYRVREDTARRFDELSRRIRELEKITGLVEETPNCPFQVTPAPSRLF